MHEQALPLWICESVLERVKRQVRLQMLRVADWLRAVISAPCTRIRRTRAPLMRPSSQATSPAVTSLNPPAPNKGSLDPRPHQEGVAVVEANAVERVELEGCLEFRRRKSRIAEEFLVMQGKYGQRVQEFKI